MNYAAHNKELHHTLELTEPTIFMKSDSSLLKDGKPFLFRISRRRFITKRSWW